VSVNSFLVLPDILLTSDLIAVVPSRLAQGARGLAVVAPPLDIPGFTKTLAWHERTHRAPGHRWAREVLFETCAGLGGEAEG
jgi:DNA-binding transcriptional LysR family regulator